MSQLDYSRLIRTLRTCKRDAFSCNECRHRDELNCVQHLLGEAADTIESLQESVNQYIKYDNYLYLHGCFNQNPEDSYRENFLNVNINEN